MRQAKTPPAIKKGQKDSRVTEVQSYLDFLSPRYWGAWLGIAGIYLMAWLPIVIRIQLSKAIAWVLFHAVSSRRKVAQTNIRLCFPNLTSAQQQDLVRQTFFSNTLNFFETAHAWCRPVTSVPFKVEGLEHYQAAVSSGKGVLVLSGHFGPIDILGALLIGKAEFSVVYRKHDNALINYFMTRARERYSKSTIARKDMKGLLRELRKGGAIWYAPDQDYGRKASIFVPFFGVNTATITMTSKLAKAGNATILPVSAYRTSDHRGFVLKIEPPPQDMPSGDEQKDALWINQWLESKIRLHPEQYLWLHKRFKTRPEGEASLYR